METIVYISISTIFVPILISIIIKWLNEKENKILISLILGIAFIELFFTFVYFINNDKKPIIWKDKAFEKMIQKALDKEGEDIYPKQLENITTLYIIGDKIAYIDKSTDEIEFEKYYRKEGETGYCKFKLKEEEGEAKKYDKKGKIISLKDIKYFKSLRELYIVLNEIEDMSPLKNCPNLEILNLDLNEIREIKIPSSFTNLKDLSLANNKIKNVSPMQSEILTNLETLYLYNNEINDISCFEKLFNRNKILSINLAYNKIFEIPNFQDYTSLTQLILESNFINNIENLSKLQSIKYLILDNNKIKNIEPLKDLTTLKYLYLNYNDISTIDSIESLDLEWLSLYQNRLTKFPKDFKNKNCELDIRYNFIKDKTSLKEFKNLKSDFKAFDVEVIPDSKVNPRLIIVRINSLHNLYNASFQWDTNNVVLINEEEFRLESPSEAGVHDLYIKAIDEFGNETEGIIGSDGSSGWLKFSYTIQSSQ